MKNEVRSDCIISFLLLNLKQFLVSSYNNLMAVLRGMPTIQYSACGKIFIILFRKFSSPNQSTFCVQISLDLADGKLVKSCITDVAENWERFCYRCTDIIG